MSLKGERDKPIVLVDVDDTLSKTLPAYSRDFGKHAVQCCVNAVQLENWLSGPKYIIEKSLQETGFYKKLLTYEHSQDVLASLTDQYDFKIATRRHEFLRDDTEVWTAQNYPGVFSDIYYGVRDKGILAAELGAIMHIDNRLTHCHAVKRQGIEAIWFAPYRWNRLGNRGLHKLAMSWRAIKEILLEQEAC
jgi:5'(3')-deoxyribonucleotidase